MVGRRTVVLTNFNPPQVTNFMTPPDMVRYSSALWAIAVSYAGSNLIFFVAVIATAVPKRSWVVYAVLTLVFWWIESYMFLFVIGLWMADAAVQGVWIGIRDGPKWRMLALVGIFELGSGLLVRMS